MKALMDEVRFEALKIWWPSTKLNRRRQPFQVVAQPGRNSIGPLTTFNIGCPTDKSYWADLPPSTR